MSKRERIHKDGIIIERSPFNHDGDNTSPDLIDYFRGSDIHNRCMAAIGTEWTDLGDIKKIDWPYQYCSVIGCTFDLAMAGMVEARGVRYLTNDGRTVKVITMEYRQWR